MHTQLIGRGNSVQTILMALVSLLVLGAIHFTPSDAQAGRMKDVHLMHLEAIAEYLYGNADTDGLETRNSSFVPAEAGYQFALVVTADLIVRCAMQRRESRGLHFSRDYPELSPRLRNTVLKRRRPVR